MTYAIIDAQGTYGDYARVYRVFATLPEADAYAKRGGVAVIASPGAEVGDRVHREHATKYEQRADGERREQQIAKERQADRDRRGARYLADEQTRPAGYPEPGQLARRIGRP